MKFKLLTKGLAGIIFSSCFFVSNASASLITIGSLSGQDDGSTVITDTLNNREWLRWDVVDNLQYQETLNAIGTGGAYEGWSIATTIDMVMFSNALLASPLDFNDCQNIAGPSLRVCGTYDISNFHAMMGENYAYDSRFSFAFYLNEDEANDGKVVGHSRFDSNGFYLLDPQQYTIPESDLRHESEWGSNIALGLQSPSDVNVGFQLYRNLPSNQNPSASVPEPSTLAIFALSVFGLASRRFIKK